MEKPLVSVCCITYNHEDYIGDCLDGFVMQQTDFPIEILIHDDASTDGTQDIIRAYKKRYPDMVKPVFQSENQYSKGVRPINKFNFERSQGKYIALCEGDDYWTNPLKLQKQVNFLEDNEGYNLTVGGFISNNIEMGEEEVVITGKKKDREYGYTFTKDDTTKGWITKTLTAVFRKKSIDDLNYKRFHGFRDVHLFYHLLQKGKGFYFTEILGKYRVHSGGVFSSNKQSSKYILHYYTYKELFEIYNDEPARKKYFEGIKALIREELVNSEEFDLLNLIKEGLVKANSLNEILELVKSVLLFLKKISYRKLDF